MEHYTWIKAEVNLTATSGIIFTTTTKWRFGRLFLLLFLLKSIQSTSFTETASQCPHGEFTILSALWSEISLAIHTSQPYQKVSWTRDVFITVRAHVRAWKPFVVYLKRCLSIAVLLLRHSESLTIFCNSWTFCSSHCCTVVAVVKHCWAASECLPLFLNTTIAHNGNACSNVGVSSCLSS